MVSFIEWRRRISYYIKGVNIFLVGFWGLSPIWLNSLSALFFSFLWIFQPHPPLWYLTNTVKDVYFFVRWRIFFGYLYVFIPNIARFSFVAKKHSHTVSDAYFLVRWRIIFENVFLFYRQYCTIFICAEKSRKAVWCTVRDLLKVPSLARSVPKPLKVPSLARSVQKPLKVPRAKHAQRASLVH